jgi:hypothetical protein
MKMKTLAQGLQLIRSAVSGLDKFEQQLTAASLAEFADTTKAVQGTEQTTLEDTWSNAKGYEGKTGWPSGGASGCS